MNEKILGLMFLLLAAVQIFIAFQISKVNKSKFIKGEVQANAETKRLNQISRSLQVVALTAFVLYIYLKV